MEHFENMQTMDLARKNVAWRAPNFGAKLAALMAQSYYPLDEETEGDRVKTSVRLPQEQHDDIELMAHLWNELDRELGRKRARKWKAASVIERLISVGIDGFWAQVGGRPASKDDREALIARVVQQAATRKKK